jgi:predicted nucleic-acid-binding Zn-ribbon protein
MKRFNILLLIGLISLAIFIIPDLSSMFMGEHNYYDQVSCKHCHVSEYDEVNRSAIEQKHINAANNTNYTTYLAIGGIEYYPSNSTIHTIDDKIWTWNGSTWINTTTILVKLDRNNNALIDGNEICHLCHNASLTGELDVHAITVRTCDDDWCHGNKNNSFNDPELLNSLQTTINVGSVLNESGNLHRSFYLSLCNESTGYTAGGSFNHTTGNRAGNYISKGYWACISCHSEVQVEITVIQGESNHTNSERRKYL